MGNTTGFRAALADELNRAAQGAHARLKALDDIAFGDAHIARYEMANGLRIFLLHDDSAQIASYHTWFAVGSRHEQPGKTGLAHLFEHLMFNEVEGLAAGEFDRMLEMAGGEVNAATWVDWTYYYENVPSSELSLVVRLEALRMHKLVLREPQLVSEKEVVANERRYRVDDDVEGAVNETLYKLAFEKHPYHWPTIGWMSDIESFTTSDCEAFYRDYYAPNNARIVVVGAFDERELLSQLQLHYGDIPRSDLKAEVPVVEPEQRQERVETMHQPTPTEKLLLGYKGPALGTDDQTALTVANEVLFGGKSSRLYRRLITEGELASEARGALSPFRDPGLYEVWISMREGRTAEQALEIIEREVANLSSELLSETELDKAKNRLELAFVHGMESANGRAEQIGFYETVLGDASLIFKQLEAFRAVDAERVRDVCKRLLVPEQRTTLFVRPSDDTNLTEEAA